MNVSGETCPAVPTTTKFKKISVPEPARFCAWNAEIMKCPAFDVFGVIAMVELNVPAIV